MAPKRASPLDEPPSASSSSSSSSSQEEEETSSENEEEETSSSDVSSSENEEEHQPTDQKTPSKNPPPSPIPNPNSQPKPSQSESDSQSDSDDEDASKPKKRYKSPPPPVSPAKSTAKRASDNNNNGIATDSKKAKKEKDGVAAEEEGKKGGDEARKLFQRIWSEDDELVVLTGLVEYAEKTGESPLKDLSKFHSFIKKSVQADISKDQLVNKIRNLKKRYMTNIGRMKNGKELRFSKPFDKHVWELSRRIWPEEEEEIANGGGIDKSNAKKKRRVKRVASDMGSPFKEPRRLDSDGEAGSLSSLSGMMRFHKSVGLSGLDDDAISRGYELIGTSKRAELEERWKKLHIAELKLLVERAELVKDQASLILEATKSSGN